MILSNAINIYEMYYKKKYKMIVTLLDKYVASGKVVALWGAGVRGKAFLKVFDQEGKRIRYIYDSDEKKFGQKLTEHHYIVNYKKCDADIVIAANNALEFRIIYNLTKAKKHAEVVNVDNYILGNTNQIKETINLTKVREQKVAAVVVIYNPDKTIFTNIETYLPYVDKLYVWDNSEKEFPDIKKKLEAMPNVEYIGCEENEGLCVPFNVCKNKALEQNMDWLITFDQDSYAAENMVQYMRQYVECEMCTKDIGIVAPTVNELDENEQIKAKRYCTFYDKVFQSGAMHRLEMMEQIGDYDENLFIDEVDYEYCARCRAQGYYIVKLSNAVLLHNVNDSAVQSEFVNGKHIYIGKFSEMRYYYKIRNALYCSDKYKKIDPLYSLECLNRMRKTELNASRDINNARAQDAIEQAKRDYKNGKMGKRGDVR